ncbi:MAG: hypothetical protein KF689_08990 [Gemmatimonadaceae bacterium]|nr:hypothetical protein [Gemmatimonadaceae bacterium]MCW5826268.1 hypothetical protein [Gemmatimonadaceae bacterium]
MPQSSLRRAAVALAFAVFAPIVGAQEPAAGGRELTPPPLRYDPNDPRIGLKPGYMDAGEAISGLTKLASVPRPAGFFNPAQVGDGGFSNTDLAFRGNLLFQGNYHGFQAFDVSDPRNPQLRLSVVCPGGQGDVSVYGNLVFMSVEQTRGRLDCGTTGVEDTVSAERFRGVRIFDISDMQNPRQVALVQTCRGSHTHTLVTHPRDRERIWVYVSGTSSVRPGEELAGCVRAADDANTSLFRIEVIEVPLARPQDARVVNMPRVFADASGRPGGLWQGGNHGPGTQTSRITNQCHDITAYPAIGLAAGACSGNGILLDISDPANPRRIDEVIDPNFAYWHSATFNNDGSTVIFTDEWGGGRGARCRATDPATWGANAIFGVRDRKMTLQGYYKLPVPQTDTENCVAHNGSLVPVPGRDLKVQAWYQGGLSLFDFTDPTAAKEVAFFDRGPISATDLITGGYWSVYWYNGRIYGAEIERGIDVFELAPGPNLSVNEIEAAKLVRFDEFNAQLQPKFEWPMAYPVARAYVDQLERGAALEAGRVTALRELMTRGETGRGAQRTQALEQYVRVAEQLERDAGTARPIDARRMRALATTLRGLQAAR